MEYRYVTLSSSGEASDGENWSCTSDVEAIERARGRAAAFGAELWRGDQRLSVIAGPMSRPDRRTRAH
ncbi:MAG TPA: hypothetical protein VJS38_01820 [Phenylobacterium sp.]|uniref:hypothetical protein n=1 Tax=Phenylobacterium sp. TaxID=1871053 RepID=UPI002B464483|nr:hypothetical protein [Phenylobacterium sp.]HKR86889.1 hypothetical protein [Phenylobacterium sp.]